MLPNNRPKVRDYQRLEFWSRVEDVLNEAGQKTVVKLVANGDRRSPLRNWRGLSEKAIDQGRRSADWFAAFLPHPVVELRAECGQHATTGCVRRVRVEELQVLRKAFAVDLGERGTEESKEFSTTGTVPLVHHTF